jgi:hypothetical protein
LISCGSRVLMEPPKVGVLFYYCYGLPQYRPDADGFY